MKKILLPMVVLSLGSLSAQEVISSSGETYSNSSGQLQWTMGEPVIVTLQNGSNAATQGFNQTNLTVSEIKESNFDYEVSLYPNPTSSHIHLDINNLDENLKIELYDASGKLLKKERFTETMKSLNMDFTPYKSGTYKVRLVGDQSEKTYSIIKK